MAAAGEGAPTEEVQRGWAAAEWAKPLASLGEANASFLGSFLDGSLPFEEWTHMAHLRMCLLTIMRHSVSDRPLREQLQAALKCVVGGIRRFNAKHADRLSVGFHWSITELWFRLLAAAAIGVDRFGASPDEDLAAALLFRPDGSASLTESRSLWTFYSKDALFGAESLARGGWVAPDVTRVTVLGGDILCDERRSVLDC
jgi:hypothetical protein